MLPDLGQRPFGDSHFTIPAIGEASCLRGFGFSMQRADAFGSRLRKYPSDSSTFP